MPLALVSSPRFVDHITPPGHPERARTRRGAAGDCGQLSRAGRRSCSNLDRRRTRTWRGSTTAEHIAAIASTHGRATMLDEDTFTSPESDEIARLAAGAVLTAVDYVLDGGPSSRALVLVRPPGHHAEADRAMGFCLYNNIAAGAACARSRGCARVAIVDYDVHHGNGTQWIFYEDPAVLFVSSHQYPFYPGTGAATEAGRGPGLGFTHNIPLDAGTRDEEIRQEVSGAGDPEVGIVPSRAADGICGIRRA